MTGRVGDELAFGELLLRIGAGSRLEIRVAGNSAVVSADGDDGLEDPGLGAKLLVTDGTALLAGVTVPAGSDGVGAEGWEAEARVAHAREAGPVALGANVGWLLADPGGPRRHGGLASVTVGVPLGSRRAVFLEAYGIATEGAGGEEAYVDGGLTHQVSGDFQLDARIGAGLGGDDAADWFVGVGAARRW